MANLLKPKMICVTLMLSCFASPTLAQWTTSTNSSCLTKLFNGVCSQKALDNTPTPCCEAISKETKNDQECMCNAVNYDTGFLLGLLTYCSEDINLTTFCENAITMTPPATLFSPPPPADLTTPDSSTTTFGSSPASKDTTSGSSTRSTIIAIVASGGALLAIIIVVVIIYCVCKGRKKVAPSNCWGMKIMKEEIGDVLEEAKDDVIGNMTNISMGNSNL